MLILHRGDPSRRYQRLLGGRRHLSTPLSTSHMIFTDSFSPLEARSHSSRYHHHACTPITDRLRPPPHRPPRSIYSLYSIASLMTCGASTLARAHIVRKDLFRHLWALSISQFQQNPINSTTSTQSSLERASPRLAPRVQLTTGVDE